VDPLLKVEEPAL